MTYFLILTAALAFAPEPLEVTLPLEPETHSVGVPDETSDKPMPVFDLDMNAYMGRWYQTHASVRVKYFMQFGGNCVTADYKMMGPKKNKNTFFVRNSVRPMCMEGMELSKSGFASQSPQEPGKIQVNLGNDADPQAPFDGEGNYWVLGLGPKNTGGKYAWAVVSSPSKSWVTILARDPDVFEAQYKDSVLAKVEAMGFTKWFQEPMETNQKGCHYLKPPSEVVDVTKLFALSP